MKVKSYIKRGNSFPVIIETQSSDFFVKLRAGMSGTHSLITEYIGNSLGKQLNLPTQNPYWIELDSSIECKEIYIEVKDLINKSHGTNIAFEYLDDLREVEVKELDKLNKKELNEIFLFDLMMINIDRSAENLNLLFQDDSVISVDYESSMLIQELLSQSNFLNNDKILQGLRNNPLCNYIDHDSIQNFLERTKQISIAKILEEIPSSILYNSNRQLIIRGFLAKQENAWQILETINTLMSMTPDTAEQNKERRNKNQAEFIRKFNENLKA